MIKRKSVFITINVSELKLNAPSFSEYISENFEIINAQDIKETVPDVYNYYDNKYPDPLFFIVQLKRFPHSVELLAKSDGYSKVKDILEELEVSRFEKESNTDREEFDITKFSY